MFSCLYKNKPFQYLILKIFLDEWARYFLNAVAEKHKKSRHYNLKVVL